MTTRKLENLHVGFWLLKDSSWCQHWIYVGLFAAIPTLFLAVKLVWDSRHDTEELVHSIATVAWICANIVWMIGEFFFDDRIRWAARPFFFLGIAVLSAYYLAMLAQRVWAWRLEES